MKKVFAFVMALALVMVGSVALAAGNPIIETSGSIATGTSDINLSVKYTVTDDINVTISWDSIEDITFKWEEQNWVVKANNSDFESQTVVFTAINNGFRDRHVTFDSNVSNYSADPFLGFTNFSKNKLTVANGDEDKTDSLTITKKNLSSLDKTSIPTAIQTLSITVTATIE